MCNGQKRFPWKYRFKKLIILFSVSKQKDSIIYEDTGHIDRPRFIEHEEI